MTDAAVISLVSPTLITLAGILQDIEMSEISSSSMSDSIGFDQVVTNTVIDETSKSAMTYDTDYVDVINHSFAMKQTWEVEGQGITIDNGYCTKVTPFITDVDVDDVTIVSE